MFIGEQSEPNRHTVGTLRARLEMNPSHLDNMNGVHFALPVGCRHNRLADPSSNLVSDNTKLKETGHHIV
jgi:hypothetical protein